MSSRRTGLVLLLAALAWTACSESATDPIDTVATIAVTPSSRRISVGDTLRLSATMFDAGAQVVSGTPTWSVEGTAAEVSASGLVTGRAVGTATIRARAPNGQSGTAIVVVEAAQANATVNINNLLLLDIAVTVDGVLDTIPRQSMVSYTVPKTRVLSVGWDLLRLRTQAGVVIGDIMGGDFAPISNPPNLVEYDIDHVLGAEVYFIPYITNLTTVPFLIGVNMGLIGENRCNCVVDAMATNIPIGYYRLYTNSNVLGYRVGSSYRGGFIYWENFYNQALSGSGRMDLSSAFPPPPSVGSELVVGSRPGRLEHAESSRSNDRAR